MSDASLPLQTILFDRLSAALTVGVHDFVPDDVHPPYVVLDGATVVDDGDKTGTGQEFTFSFSVWSAKRGKK